MKTSITDKRKTEVVQRLGSTVLIFLLGLLPLFSSAQTRTVGVLQYDPATSPGYTLLAPQRSDSIWLIDECGRVLHSWHDGLEPGNSTYLLENGHLLRTSSEGQSANPSFVAGGAADHIRLYDWDNTLLWNFTWSTPTTRLHHDIAYLPNGNIVLLAWEYKSVGEALTSGRDPSEISAFGLWPETLVEIRPIFPDSGEIVWEWHAWDHLVQDYDSNLANFGNPSDHPELLDLNYLGDAGVGTVDWLHCNSVAYHPDLDQIMLSSREFSEIWILDHSTTTAEAAGHTGGNQGRGGDLIYRWGNPEAYLPDSAALRQLYVQHDAHWIPDTLIDGGQIMVFNNGTDRPGGNLSTVEIIAPPVNGAGAYAYTPGNVYGPATPQWTWPGYTGFYSKFVSNAQRLPGGNTLINEGVFGHLIEITPQNDIVWEYYCPVDDSGRIAQGHLPNPGPNATWNNRLFRAYKYPPDYPAFSGRNLSPGGLLEIDPAATPCVISGQPEPTQASFSLAPNPAESTLWLSRDGVRREMVRAYDLQGREIAAVEWYGKRLPMEVAGWPSGLYLIRVGKTSRRVVIAR